MRKTARALMIAAFCLGLIAKNEGCMFCAFPHKRIRDRFEKLCGEYKTMAGTANCSKYTEANLVNFQLDEVLVNMISEKVHRVLRVIEINQTLADLPNFWNWLYEKKLPQLTHEWYSTTVVNCSLCLEMNVNCWNMKTCWPNRLDLRESIYLIFGLSASSILFGLVTLIFESRKFQAKTGREVK
ncbi:sperm-egg fusion protein TMEM95-like isoform X2 [Narcine bancroftii]|uniref:sperm-egg fusion protein TMEM95-like isoform X2 n=1 Tax=Narcine bancroftii TaxID=1343680 RepID=UPI0038313DD9